MNQSNQGTRRTQSLGKPTNQLRPNQIIMLFWFVAALVLAIMSCVFNNSAMVLNAGFIAKCFAVVVATLFGVVGANLGDAIRKFAMPDAFYTSGGMLAIIKTKLFWYCGPQLIGLFIGVFFGMSLVLS